MKHMTFTEMISALRAGAIAGMNTTITLDPEGAKDLADMMEARQQALFDEIEKAFDGLIEGED